MFLIYDSNLLLLVFEARNIKQLHVEHHRAVGGDRGPASGCLEAVGKGEVPRDVEPPDATGLHGPKALVESRNHRTRPNPEAMVERIEIVTDLLMRKLLLSSLSLPPRLMSYGLPFCKLLSKIRYLSVIAT